MVTKVYDMRDVWIDQATQYTSVKMNTFDLNSEVNSKLLDLKRNGISQFTVNKLGELVFGTLDIPRVNSLEETITSLASAGLARVDHISSTVASLATELNFNAGTIAMVYQDPTVTNNDWYVKIGSSGIGSWEATGLLPQLATFLTPRKGVSRTVYVTMDGNDDVNNGRSIYKPVQTINKALEIARTISTTPGEGPCVVLVHPGEYEVEPYTEIPANVTLYGYDARATKLRIAEGFANTNMFLLNSGCKVRGFTFSGLQHESEWMGSSENSQGSLDFGPPKYGYAFAFKPGAYITRSPYLSDCSSLHSLNYNQMSLPQDKSKGNPLMPLGLGNLYADGSVCDPDSPLRSVVVDSFTAVNPNGVGYAVVNSALVQLVSVFTNWSRVGIWSHSGGQVTVVNSNATFGDYAFASTGYRYAIRVPRLDSSVKIENLDNVGNYINNNFESIVTDLMNVRYNNIPNWTTISANAEYLVLTERDTRTILTELAQDMVANVSLDGISTPAADDSGLAFWVQGLFKTVNSGPFTANAIYAFDQSLLPFFTGTFNQIRNKIKDLTLVIPGAEASANNFVDAYFNMAINILENPTSNNFSTVFQSKVEAASHQFSYSGSGVNYNALPFGQRGAGTAPAPNENLYTSNGGVIYATYNTEQGDTYLGPDLRVDFERSVIEGQAFSRGVQNIVLPLIIGVGG